MANRDHQALAVDRGGDGVRVVACGLLGRDDPAQGIAEAVVHAAMTKISSENNTRAELEEGKLLLDVYNKYGVL